MRISQIKTLCWSANTIVLLGAGYVGLHFWETYEARSQRTEAAWPEEAGKPTIERRWPGEISGFQEIWTTPVDGEVPKPPPPPPPPTPPDLKADFLAKHEFVSAMFVLGSPEDSVAYVRSAGKDVPLRTGEVLAGFTLVGFAESDETGAPVLVFTHPKLSELVRMVRVTVPLPPVFDPPPFREVTENDLVKPTVKRNEIPRRAYQDLVSDPSGLTWFVPAEEMAWWAAFGEEEVFAKLVVNVAEAQDGTPRGIRLMSQPGQGTPVGTGRGLVQGDIVVSINEVPVRGKEDILRYLRGDGRHRSRYDVVVESEGGGRRTVVYNVERRPSR